MAMVQIDERELAQLRAGYKLSDSLYANAKTKREFQKLVKTLDPNIQTDDDAAEPMLAPIREELETLKKWRKEREDKEIEDSFAARFAQLKKDGYTDEGLDKLKKLMVDRQIPDVDAAAALFEKQNPAPQPLPPAVRSNDWDIGDKGDEKYKKLIDDPDKFARDEAAKVLTEVAQNGRPEYGDHQFGWGQPR